MADVFISYASEDRDRAAKLAEALNAQGWSAWWDRKIVTGQSFDQVIERELQLAKAVVVLWSGHSVVSEWVKNEASAASERGILVPALIDNVQLPLEFRRKQTADLSDWHGDSAHSGFRALCEGIASLMGGAAPRVPPLRREPAVQGKPRWVMGTIAAVVIGAVGLIYAMRPVSNSRDDSPKTRKPEVAVTPQPVNPSFDCAKASTATERLICSSRSISILDLQLANAFREVIAHNPPGKHNAIRLSQLDWIRTVRDRCPSVDCLESEYTTRIRELDAQYRGEKKN